MASGRSSRSRPSLSSAGRCPCPLSPAARTLVDLHCHILPGLDDGARDLDDALGMARQAHADGITAVCATPHIRHDHDVRITELRDRVAELNAALDSAGIGVTVLSGGEVASTALEGLTRAELEAVSLGAGGRWILLEPGARTARRSARGRCSPVARPWISCSDRASRTTSRSGSDSSPAANDRLWGARSGDGGVLHRADDECGHARVGPSGRHPRARQRLSLVPGGATRDARVRDRRADQRFSGSRARATGSCGSRRTASSPER